MDPATWRALTEGFYPRGWWRSLVVLSYVFIIFLPLADWWVDRVFSWLPSVLWWAFYVITASVERFVVRRFSRVAAVILWRGLGAFSGPLSLVLVQLFMRDAVRDWTAMLVVGFVACLVTWFHRPQATFALLPKALRNAA
ncbi:hypothetical protein [Deinococcus frigens]|uniref:hypothetical protein n=1 Tax=Deinococcus frigens TaxID=249403 RepID=UPI0012EC71E7|nr:hypothetical protein [Deinococcus frigens]